MFSEFIDSFISKINSYTGGLKLSELINSRLVDAFVPFFPLERKHVKQCVAEDIIRKGYPLDAAAVDKIADSLRYFPDDTKLYAVSGCKDIPARVDFHIGILIPPHPDNHELYGLYCSVALLSCSLSYV
jgi:hypothetical protein